MAPNSARSARGSSTAHDAGGRRSSASHGSRGGRETHESFAGRGGLGTEGSGSTAGSRWREDPLDGIDEEDGDRGSGAGEGEEDGEGEGEAVDPFWFEKCILHPPRRGERVPDTLKDKVLKARDIAKGKLAEDRPDLKEELLRYVDGVRPKTRHPTNLGVPRRPQTAPEGPSPSPDLASQSTRSLYSLRAGGSAGPTTCSTGLALLPEVDGPVLRTYINDEQYTSKVVDFIKKKREARLKRMTRTASTRSRRGATSPGGGVDVESTHLNSSAAHGNSRVRAMLRQKAAQQRHERTLGRLADAEGAMHAHLDAIRPVKPPPTPPPDPGPDGPDWDAILGRDGPDDNIPTRMQWAINRLRWQRAAALRHRVNASDMRAIVKEQKINSPLDMSKRMVALENPMDKEDILYPTHKVDLHSLSHSIQVGPRPKTAPGEVDLRPQSGRMLEKLKTMASERANNFTTHPNASKRFVRPETPGTPASGARPRTPGTPSTRPPTGGRKPSAAPKGKGGRPDRRAYPNAPELQRTGTSAALAAGSPFQDPVWMPAGVARQRSNSRPGTGNASALGGDDADEMGGEFPIVDGSLLDDSVEGQWRWNHRIDDELKKLELRIQRGRDVHTLGPPPSRPGGFRRRESKDSILRDDPMRQVSARGRRDASSPRQNPKQQLRKNESIHPEHGAIPGGLQLQVGAGENELNMRHSKLTTIQIAAVCVLLTRPNNQSLTRLVLMDNSLDDSHWMMILNGLDGTRHLRLVDLRENHLTVKSMETFAKVLITGKCPDLTTLLLGNNQLGDAGVTVLSDVLASNRCNLKHLDISANEIGLEGCHAIGFLMQSNTHMTWLDIGWNRIGTRGGVAIGEGLRVATSMITLHVTNAALRDEGAAYIAQALKMTESLRNIDLSGNGLGRQTCMVLASSIRSNQRFRRVVLDGNPLGEDGAADLVECLARGYVAELSIDNCNLKPIRDGASGAHQGSLPTPTFNIKQPNDTYTLDLSNAAHYEVAVILADRWHTDGAKTWTNVTLNGHAFTLTEAQNWPAAMKEEGTLKLDFRTPYVVADSRIPMTDSQMRRIFGRYLDRAAIVTDEWRQSFVSVVASQLYVRSDQASRILEAFTYEPEQVEAGITLLGQLSDPYNMHCVLRRLKPAVSTAIEQRLGVMGSFNPSNPCGRWKLNLAQATDYAIAQRLLTCWSVEVQIGVCVPRKMQRCWRNVRINEEYMPTHGVAPSTIELPREGNLFLDYVTYAYPEYKKSALIAAGNARMVLPSQKTVYLPGRLFQSMGQVAMEYACKRRVEDMQGYLNETKKVFESLAHGSETNKQAMSEYLRRRQDLNFNKIGHEKLGFFGMMHMQTLVSILIAEKIPTPLEFMSIMRQIDGDGPDDVKVLQDQLQHGVMPHNEAARKLYQLTKENEMRQRAIERRRTGSARGARPRSGRPGSARLGQIASAALNSARLSRMSATGGESAHTSGQLPENATLEDALPEGVEEDAPATPGKGKDAKKGKDGKRAPIRRRGMTALKAGLDQFVPEPTPPMGIPRHNVRPSLMILRRLTSDYYFTAAAVDVIVELFDASRDKADILVWMWARVLDRERFPHLLRCVPQDVQVSVCRRIGWYNILDLADPDMHYLLDLKEPDDFEVGRLLFKMSVSLKGRNVNNLTLNGKPHPIKEENFLLYGVIVEKLERQKEMIIEFDYYTKTQPHARVSAAKVIEDFWRASQKAQSTNLKHSYHRMQYGVDHGLFCDSVIGVGKASRPGSATPPSRPGSAMKREIADAPPLRSSESGSGLSSRPTSAVRQSMASTGKFAMMAGTKDVA